MATSSQTQLSAALALAQLLQEHPTLPVAGWSIDSIFPVLHGHVHEEDMAALAAFAEVLGGSIRPNHEYEYQGRKVRSHRLSAVWRDVRVEIAIVLPVAAEAVTA
ncbi:hypothetical protein [Streptomyces sp. BBFR109]|uniref:hypothetical protein n=1 Tax=Streptomyces sp. BBFR109 TaxID=3448172 RepID=UPI003F75BE9A